jgi:hypothetical protein
MTTAMGYKNPELFFKPPQKQPKVDPQTGQPVTDPNTGQPVMESQPPPPQPSPQEKVAQINAQTTMQVEQMHQNADQQKFQAQAGLDQQKVQMEAAAKQHDQQNALALQASNDQRDAQAQQMQHERELQKMAMQDALDREKMNREFEFKYWEAGQKQQTEQSRMQHEANTQTKIAQASGVDVNSEDKVTKALGPVLDAMHGHIAHVAEMTKAMHAPKQIVRDKNGRAIGVQTIQGH